MKAEARPHFPNRTRTTRQIAQAAFPACRTDEERIAALLRAEWSADLPKAADNTMRSLRESLIGFLDRERKAPQP